MSALIAERLTGIGGSDLHHLWNLEPYGCARQLAYEKLDVKQDHPFDETPAMRRGKWLEEAAAQEYELLTGNKVRTEGMLRHPQHQWAIVHLDRYQDSPRAVVEIKVPGREMFFKILREGLPDGYILQAQHGTWLAGAERCVFVVFNADAWRCVPFDVFRDEDLIYAIQQTGEEFWERTDRARRKRASNEDWESELPLRLASDSKQCQRCPWRTRCQGENLIPAKDRGPVQRDNTLAGVVSEYVEAKQIEDEAGDLVSAARARLEKALGDRPGVEVDGFRVHFRHQPGSMRINEAKAQQVYRSAHVKCDLDGSLVWPTPAEIATGIKAPSKPSRPLRVFAI